ncbi:MAG: SDR family oxidoreductase [Polyangiales bacterium]
MAEDGTEVSVDTIIFATGFHVADASIASRVIGREEKRLSDVWNGTPSAYLGTTVHGFPNFFTMLGPNLGNGHGSAHIIIEAQANYIADAIRTVSKNNRSVLEVRKDAQTRWNDRVQEALQGTVWNAGGCKSWYLDENGVNSAIYPWSTIDMRRRMRRFDPNAFETTSISVGDGMNPAKQKKMNRSETIDLKGAVVVITGAAHGIGLATAKRFIEAGSRVALGDLDIDACRREAARLGSNAYAYHLDVSERASFESFVSRVEHDLGDIDILVNNAGVMPSGSFFDEDDAANDAVMRVNHWGTALGMKIVIPKMIQRGRGHVVNVASLAGKFAVPNLASYVASKHATVGLSAAVRQEMLGTGVSLSVVLPSAVNTRLADGIPKDKLFAQEPIDVANAIIESVRTKEAEITVPRWGKPFVSLYSLLPRNALPILSKLLGADRLLAPSVRQARARYEANTVAQGKQGLSGEPWIASHPPAEA